MSDNYLLYTNTENFGKVTHIVRKDGLAIISIEQPKGEKDVAYIYGLNVHETARKQGLGNDILKEAENYLIKTSNVQFFVISAKRGWLTNWYCRNGYNVYKYNAEDKVNMLSKIINRNNNA